MVSTPCEGHRLPQQEEIGQEGEWIRFVSTPCEGHRLPQHRGTALALALALVFPRPVKGIVYLSRNDTVLTEGQEARFHAL